MYVPVLVEGPDEALVSLDEAKMQCRVDDTDQDALIEGLIASAVDHVERHIQRKLVTQTWRQEYDGFCQEMRIPFPLAPDAEVSVVWQDDEGQFATIDEDDYVLREDRLGPYVRFGDDFDLPSDLAESAAVQVEFETGYGPPESVPAGIKQAVQLLVAHWFANREAVSADGLQELPLAVHSLLANFRRFV